jgi:putative aldouronate transport system permease protein
MSVSVATQAAGAAAKRTRIKQSKASRAFDVGNYFLLALLGLVTIGPFLYLGFASLTESNYYRVAGVSISPQHWSLDSYLVLLGGASRIYQALRITLFVTVVGTALSLLTTAGLAYGLSQHEVPGRAVLLFYVFFTMLFGGGMVPFYLVASWLGLVNTVWALIIPMMVNPWNMFIMMKFFESIPADLQDAARIDGCSELAIFWRVIIPLSMPVMATIGLFYAVNYWNEWFWATIFISKAELMPLQVVLRGILSQLLQVLDPQAAVDQAQMAQQVVPPVEVLRMAAIVVTILPIALVYPFLQRYFVKGVLIGAIKG